MSTVPARTRSQRRPTAESGRPEKPSADIPAEIPRERGNVSPSRLPKPQSTAIRASSRSSRTTQTTRPATSSTANSSTTRPPQRAGTSRPPLTSDNKALSQRSGARTPTETTVSLQRRPSTRHSRNASTSALPTRPGSSSGSSSNNNTLTQQQLLPPTGATIIRPPSSTSTSSLTQLSHKDPHHSRPPFTTHLQHFSPLRTAPVPKPLISSILAPPSPSKTPSAVALSTETSRLQAELLQLHLLHRSAAPVLSEYRTSARTKLRARFEDVRDKHEELIRLEAGEKERRTVRALRYWDQDGSLDTKVQVLDEVLAAVWKISEPGGGGRYAKVVRRFERWLESAATILEARKRDSGGDWGDGDGMEMFVEELEAEWKSEVQNLSRKLAQWTQQLQAFGEADMAVPEGQGQGASSKSSSGLAIVVRGVRELVKGMVEEVRAMERIEREVIFAEENWRREAIEEEEDDGDDEGAKAGGAVWRTLR